MVLLSLLSRALLSNVLTSKVLFLRVLSKSVAFLFITMSFAIQANQESLEGHEIVLSDSKIYVSFAPGQLALSETQILEWVRLRAKNVSAFYGRFPISSLMLLVQPVSGDDVVSGTAYGGEVPYLVIRVGDKADSAALDRDWVLVHEMVHLALPQLRRPHYWLEEGVATYIEPFVRHEANLVDEAYIWKWLAEGLPNGLPPHNTGGLDHNMSWGNIYWGGTLFCFIADMEIRQATKGRLGLKDALVAVLDSGGNMKKDWKIRDVLNVADQGIGMPILNKLYTKMSKDIGTFDLDAIWRDLGVQSTSNGLVLNDKASKAWLRKSLIGG